MWKGRFQTETSNLVQRYGESISYDWRLYAHDIEGSLAHAAALVEAGILTKTEEKTIGRGLREIKREIEAGEFRFKTSLEDVHMNIERALTEKIGAAGAKLHTARSRNDIDMTMYRMRQREFIISLAAAALTGPSPGAPPESAPRSAACSMDPPS